MNKKKRSHFDLFLPRIFKTMLELSKTSIDILNSEASILPFFKSDFIKMNAIYYFLFYYSPSIPDEAGAFAK